MRNHLKKIKILMFKKKKLIDLSKIRKLRIQ